MRVLRQIRKYGVRRECCFLHFDIRQLVGMFKLETKHVDISRAMSVNRVQEVPPVGIYPAATLAVRAYLVCARLVRGRVPLKHDRRKESQSPSQFCETGLLEHLPTWGSQHTTACEHPHSPCRAMVVVHAVRRRVATAEVDRVALDVEGSSFVVNHRVEGP